MQVLEDTVVSLVPQNPLVSSGSAYFDGTTYLYVVYGVDGAWQATRADLVVTLSTAPNQAGTRPSTISALEELAYS